MTDRKWPWVRRSEHERVVRNYTDLVLRHSTDASRATKELDVEHQRFMKEIGGAASLVKQAEARAEMAERRATAAEERAVRAMEHAQLVIADALRLSQTAAKTLFGVEESGDVEPAPSVRTADRDYARRQRESQERGR